MTPLIRMRYLMPVWWTVLSIVLLSVSLGYALYGLSIFIRIIGILAAVLNILALAIGIFAINKARKLP